MASLTTPARAVMALCMSLAMTFFSASSASAAPTAEFTYDPTAPAVAQPVRFTFTGTCDVAPCRIQWRWFRTGGSSLGTSMGEGPVVTYAFSDVGTYFVVAKITNASKAHSVATVTHALPVRATYQDDYRRVGYNSWRGVFLAAASDGGYRVASGSKATAALTFSGPEVTYVARTGPDEGLATVTVDATSYGSVDLYAATAGTRSLAVTGLPAGSHRITVKAKGTKNAASTGTAVSLDEFVVGTTHYDDRHDKVVYDTWSSLHNRNADGGTVRASATANASTMLTFTGGSVTWVTGTGPDQGRASLAIDGRIVQTVDNYASVRTWKVARTYGGLSSGAHTITVTVAGTRNPRSTAAEIVSDAFVVR